MRTSPMDADLDLDVSVCIVFMSSAPGSRRGVDSSRAISATSPPEYSWRLPCRSVPRGKAALLGDRPFILYKEAAA